MKLIEEIFGKNRNTFREDSGDMKFAGFEVANYISDAEKKEYDEIFAEYARGRVQEKPSHYFFYNMCI